MAKGLSAATRSRGRVAVPGVVATALALGMAPAAFAANPACPSATASTATSCTYSKVGTWTFTVPTGVDVLKVTTAGAVGGAGKEQGNKSLPGDGALVQDSSVPVSPGSALTAVVGGAGKAATFTKTTSGVTKGHGGAGGFPGGGAGGDPSSDNPNATGYGGGGGGYSALLDPSNDPLVLGAGGGGGGGGNDTTGGRGGDGDTTGSGGQNGQSGNVGNPGGGGGGGLSYAIQGNITKSSYNAGKGKVTISW